MIAPQSKSQAKERAGDVQRQKESWGEKKSLARAIRERRKAYW
jgi:ribosomal protein S6